VHIKKVFYFPYLEIIFPPVNVENIDINS